jgi:protocatechuate 3,4-dioxygenase beta subunit
MKLISFLIVAFLFSLQTFAGGNLKLTSMKGKVVDNEGNPLVGAKVVWVDGEKEAYTDFDGNFEFEKVSPEEQTLKVDHISFEGVTATLKPKLTNELSEVEIKMFSK